MKPTHPDSIGEAQEVFDVLSRYFMNHPEAPSGTLLEAVDYVANYCGDIAKGRKVTFDKPKDAFPTIYTKTRTDALKEAREVVEDEMDLSGSPDSADWNGAIATASSRIEELLDNKEEDAE